MAQENIKAPLADKLVCPNKEASVAQTQKSQSSMLKTNCDMAAKLPTTVPATYICDICGQEGLSEWQMRSHVLIEHIEGQISCPFCDLEGTTLEEMTLHVNTLHLGFLSPVRGDDGSEESKGNALRIEDCQDKEAKLTNMEKLSSNGKTSVYDNASKSMSESSDSFSLKYSCGSSQHDVTTGVPSPMEITVMAEQDSPPKQPEQCYPSGSLKRAKLSLKVPSTTSSTTCANALSFTVRGEDRDVNCNVSGDGSDTADAYSCPLCGWSTNSSSEITKHVNVAHLDAVTPTKSHTTGALLNAASRNSNVANNESSGDTSSSNNNVLECPLCGWTSASGSTMELHVNSQHGDILSPHTPASLASSPSLLCPVCGMGCYDTISLQNHVDGHFSAQQTPVSDHGVEDSLLAQELDRSEKEAARLNEQKEFEKLQEKYGMSGTKGGYRQQAERSMETAVCHGQMSITDFYSKKWEAHSSTFSGIEDGHSCTKGIMEQLEQYYGSASCGVSRHWLASPMEHYAASHGDKGWGCGYRNFQMTLSCLALDPNYQKALFNGRPLIPSLPKIQRLIEAAWQKGFDRAGSEQLGGILVNTTKWIGATEIVATLSSLKVRCQLIDFHAPTGTDNTHPELFRWVRDYFHNCGDFRPPLYLQHQGHSRTIVGVEEVKESGSLRLLLFDPSCSKKQMGQFVTGPINANLMRSLRRPLHTLKAKQYQIVAVKGIATDKEFEESKMLKSDRFP